MIRSRAFQFLKDILTGSVQFSASPRLLGRYTGGAGDGQEIQLGAGLSFVGDTLTLSSGGGAWGSIVGTLSAQTDLQAALDAKAPTSHSHTSADISDATSGVVGGVLVKRDIFGGASFNGLSAENGSFAFLDLLNWLNFSSGAGGSLVVDALTLSRTWTLPDVSGKVGILPVYADSTAADAAVSFGDAWWDSTLKKGRVRLNDGTTDSLTTSNGSAAAAAGKLGEYLSGTHSGLSLTTDTPLFIASVALTAGDWDLEGMVTFIGVGSTTMSDRRAGITATSNMLDGDSFEARNTTPTTAEESFVTLTLSRRRVRISSPETRYLVVQTSFSAGAVTAMGNITARRVR